MKAKIFMLMMSTVLAFSVNYIPTTADVYRAGSEINPRAGINKAMGESLQVALDSEVGYTQKRVNLFAGPNKESTKLLKIKRHNKIIFTIFDEKWNEVWVDGYHGYVLAKNVFTKEEYKAYKKEQKEKQKALEEAIARGPKLTKQAGRITNAWGYEETYYNLDMSGIILIMRNMEFSEVEYPYWIRSDGCKMLGDYIMVAADLSIHPRGSTVTTSLGEGLVCDTGGFIYINPHQFDIATSW